MTDLAELTLLFWQSVVFDDRGIFRPCWFAQHDGAPCSGPTQACHWIKRRRVENELRTLGCEEEEILLAAWDPRNAVAGCEAHHTRFDFKRMPALVIFREQVPAAVEAFARDWGLEWSLERDHRPITAGV